jgi:SAM-dependent methyltransferase
MSTPNVLDATCGGRSIWTTENKHRSDAIYADTREESSGFVDFALPESHRPNNPNYEVAPDIVSDYRTLPFADESFSLIVFDPPHIVRNDGMKTLTGVITKKYGCLNAETWQDDLRRGFVELFRVLKPDGTLVFIFCDESTTFGKVLSLAPHPPLFGTRIKGTSSSVQTRWFVFRKEESQ